MRVELATGLFVSQSTQAVRDRRHPAVGLPVAGIADFTGGAPPSMWGRRPFSARSRSPRMRALEEFLER